MKNGHGFTLIELMVTLAVVAIVLTAGVPAFTRFIAANSAAADTNQVVTALNFARSEAVRRGNSVSICSANVALNACAAGSWQNGWLVFEDNNSNGSYESAGDSLLRTETGPNGATVTATAPSMRFEGAGNASSAEVFTVRPTTCDGDMERQVDVSLMGMISTAKVGC